MRHSICAAALLLIVAAPLALAADAYLATTTGTRGLIMIDKVGGMIRLYEPANDQELAAFEAGEGPEIKPHDLVIAPDHRTAYVTVYGDGVYGNNPRPGHSIAIVDLVARKLVGSIDVAPYQAPHGIQIGADGMLYVACDLSRKVLVIDPKKRSIEAAIDVEGTGHWIALTPDNRKLYVANKNDRLFISVVDVKARKMTGKVPMPNGTQGIVAAPDGRSILGVDIQEPVLKVISTVSDTVIDSVRVDGADRGVYKAFFSPDGRWLLVCQTNGQINIFDGRDLHAPQRILKSAGTALMGFAFAADGKTALVGNHGQGTVTRFDLATATVINTFPAGKGVETLAYF